MKRLFVLLLIMMLSVVTMSGCDFWGETDFEASGGDNATDDGTADEETPTPAFVKSWFYREFGDPADFPDLAESTDRQTVLAVAGWVAGFDSETADAHQYRTTGETVIADAGDSSSLAWLAFHGCRANGITTVSVELVEWDDGTEAYVCIWLDDDTKYIIDGRFLMHPDYFLSDAGRLAYGFDDIDYWEYE